MLLPGIGKLRYGLTAVEVLSYGTDEVGSEGKQTLGDMPIAIVTAQSSGHGPANRETAEYLRQCGAHVTGAHVTEMRLAELGILGNGQRLLGPSSPRPRPLRTLRHEI